MHVGAWVYVERWPGVALGARRMVLHRVVALRTIQLTGGVGNCACSGLDTIIPLATSLESIVVVRLIAVTAAQQCSTQRGALASSQCGTHAGSQCGTFAGTQRGALAGSQHCTVAGAKCFAGRLCDTLRVDGGGDAHGD